MPTQLTDISTFDASTIIFADPQKNTVPDTKPVISYTRVPISVRYPDGSTGDLVLPTSRCFSFGIQANEDERTGAVNNYSMSLVLYSRDGPTPEEENWVTTFNSIISTAESWILENKEELGKYDLTAHDLKKLNPLWWKKEIYTDPNTGKSAERRVPGRGPTLYPKLLWQRGSGDITTRFFDELSDEVLNPHDLIGQRSNLTAAVKIESIYVGKSISIQVKLVEANVSIVDNSYRRLLVGASNDSMLTPTTSAPASQKPMSTDVDEAPGSLEASDAEEEAEEVVEPPKPAAAVAKKRVVRKVVKKATA